MDDLRKLAEAATPSLSVRLRALAGEPWPFPGPDPDFGATPKTMHEAADCIDRLLDVVEKARAVDEKLRCNPVFPDDDAAVELGVALRALSGAGTRTASDE